MNFTEGVQFSCFSIFRTKIGVSFLRRICIFPFVLSGFHSKIAIPIGSRLPDEPIKKEGLISGPSSGSRMKERGSVFEFLEDDHRVVYAEAKIVVCSIAYGTFNGCVGRDVQIAVRVGRFVVDRRRDDLNGGGKSITPIPRQTVYGIEAACPSLRLAR